MTDFTDTKDKILRSWDHWIKRQPSPDNPSGREARQFYLELHSAQSPLLNFEAGSIDRWLIVHGWLLEAGRVKA